MGDVRETPPDDQPGTTVDIDNQRPTSSNGDFLKRGERDEIVKMWKQIDEKLEDKAKSHNLSAINVKSILHHLIKNPQVISVVMGLEGGETDIPSVKLTRSKTKSSRSMGKSSTKEFSTPVSVARTNRTFLNVNYESDEEDDDDYRPECDPLVEPDLASESDADGDVDETLTSVGSVDDDSRRAQVQMNGDINSVDTDAQLVIDEGCLVDDSIVNHTRSKTNLNSTAAFDALEDEHNELFQFSGIQELRTYVDDDDYLDFLHKVQNPTPMHGNESNVDEEDPDDQDYNVWADTNGFAFDERDVEEIRQDRATEIPAREVEGMYMDLLVGGETIAPLLSSSPIEPSVKKKRKSQADQLECVAPVHTAEKTTNISPSLAPQSQNFGSLVDTSEYSCSILNVGNVTFSDGEISQLRIQLEQHVQLLTQLAVSCQFEENSYPVKDGFYKMLNELDSLFYQHGPSSLFNISNMGAAIETCHDILKVEKVNVWVPERNANGHIHATLNMNLGYICPYPRPETCLVLARSRALKYPRLVIETSMVSTRPNVCQFTEGENLLLALGMIQFRHLPCNSNPFSRYHMIHRHILPSKSPNQIRNHMKNVRCVALHNPNHKLYSIILQAEREGVKLLFPLFESECRTDSMASWPDAIKPSWTKWFSSNYRIISDHQIRALPPPRPPPPKPGSMIRNAPRQKVNDDEHVHLNICIMRNVERAANISRVIDRCDCARVNVNLKIQRQKKASPVSDTCFKVPSGSVQTLQFPNVSTAPVCNDKNTILEDQMSCPFDEDLTDDLSDFLDSGIHVDASTSLTSNSGMVLDPTSREPLPCLGHDAEIPSSANTLIPAEPMIESSFSLECFEEMPATPALESSSCSAFINADSEIITVEASGKVPLFTKPRSVQNSAFVSAPFISIRNPNSDISVDKSTLSAPQNTDNEVRNEDIVQHSMECTNSEVPRLADFGKEPIIESSVKPPVVKKSRRKRKENKTIDSDVLPLTPKEVPVSDGPVLRYSLRKRVPPRTISPSPKKKRFTCLSVEDTQEPSVSPALSCALFMKEETDSQPPTPVPEGDEYSRDTVLSRDTVIVQNAILIGPRSTPPRFDMPTPNTQRIQNICNQDLSVEKNTRSIPHSAFCLPAICELSKSPMPSRNSFRSETPTMGFSRTDSMAIPSTPEPRTPSDIMSPSSIFHLSGNNTPEYYDYSRDVPRTPRGDLESTICASPSLILRATKLLNSSSSTANSTKRALFGKNSGKTKTRSSRITTVEEEREDKDIAYFPSNDELSRESAKRDEATNASASEVEMTDVEMTDHEIFDDLDQTLTDAVPDDAIVVDEVLITKSSEPDPPKRKRLSKVDRARMGVETLRDGQHMHKGMDKLARRIAIDVNQRLMLHDELRSKVQQLIGGGKKPTQEMWDQLASLLAPVHPDVLCLLSLLVSPSLVSADLLCSPLRRAYQDAIDMLFAIEAYTVTTRTTKVRPNAKNIFKNIADIHKQTSHDLDEMYRRLNGLFENETALWAHLRQFCHSLHPDTSPPTSEFEIVDLRIQPGAAAPPSIPKSIAQFECIDDLDAILGVAPKREKTAALCVSDGQLMAFSSSVGHVGVTAKCIRRDTKVGLQKKEARAQAVADFKWTDVHDAIILQMYNEIDGTNDQVASCSAKKLKLPVVKVKERLEFLLSLFSNK